MSGGDGKGILEVVSASVPRTAPGVTVLVLACLAAGCGSSTPGPSPVANVVPTPPAPSRAGNILLEIVSSSPAAGAALPRGTMQRFTARLRYDAADSAASPLFLVGHLMQWNGAVSADNPGDFHFPTPGRSGETEAEIERTLIGSPGAVWITWTLAMRNPDGTTFPGASFTTTFVIL